MNWDDVQNLSVDEMLDKSKSTQEDIEKLKEFRDFLTSIIDGTDVYIPRIEEGVNFYQWHKKQHPKEASVALANARGFILNFSEANEMSGYLKNLVSTMNGNLKCAWEIYQKYYEH